MNTRDTFLMALGLAASIATTTLTAKPEQGYRSRPNQNRVVQGMNTDQHNFNAAMRKLWEDHTNWTRQYIVSAVNNLPNKSATTARLLQNQVDIGDAIKPIYGETAGNKLSALLKSHILIAAEVVNAAKANDSRRLSSQKNRWFDNGDQIADFLSAANPSNWSKNEMRDMMREHLDITLEEASAEIKGDYRTSVRKYDQIHTQILKMADMLSEGIISQFPGKFSLGTSYQQPVTTGYTAMRMDSGTVIPFTLSQRLSSNESVEGDRFTANLDTNGSSSYQGMTTGTVLEGHVDVARPKTGDTPGVLGLAFDRVRMPDGQTYNVRGTLIGLDSNSVTNENGRLTAKPGAKNDNLKYVGYGAGGGAIVALLTKGNLLSNALIGGALGYLYGEIKKDPSKSNNVVSEPGTKFGVRLTRDLDYQVAATGR